MATFVTIGYGDRAGCDRIAPALRDAAMPMTPDSGGAAR